MTEEHAKQLCSWKYEDKYSVYNFPSWDAAVQRKLSITNPKIRAAQFRSVINEQHELIGFFRMTEDKHGRIEIGLGLKPGCCGHGLGKEFVSLITRYAKARYPNRIIYMEVRSFNKRAVKCYNSCGYKIFAQHHKDFPCGSDDCFLMEYRDTEKSRP